MVGAGPGHHWGGQEEKFFFRKMHDVVYGGQSHHAKMSFQYRDGEMHTLTGNKGLKTAHSKYNKFRRKWNAPSDSSGSSSEEDMYRGYQPHVNASIAQSTPKANSSTLRIMRKEASVPRIKPQKQVSSAELIRRARDHDLSARSMAQSHSPSAIAASFKKGQDTRGGACWNESFAQRRRYARNPPRNTSLHSPQRLASKRASS